MAGDSLKWIVAPLPYSIWWVVLAVLLILLTVGWFVGVLVWTLPAARLRTIPVLRDISARVLARKFGAAVGRVDQRYRTGELSARQAYTEMSRILAQFRVLPHRCAGAVHGPGEVAHSSAAAAAPMVSALYARQFELMEDPNVAARRPRCGVRSNHGAEMVVDRRGGPGGPGGHRGRRVLLAASSAAA